MHKVIATTTVAVHDGPKVSMLPTVAVRYVTNLIDTLRADGFVVDVARSGNVATLSAVHCDGRDLGVTIARHCH